MLTRDEALAIVITFPKPFASEAHEEVRQAALEVFRCRAGEAMMRELRDKWAALSPTRDEP